MTINQLKWLSTQKPPTAVSNKSRLQDLFTDTDIFSSHSKLVRESVQNSIDARISSPSRMRFYIGQAQPKTGLKYFKEQLPRFKKCLRNFSDLSLPFKYIVIEDFNTSGLLGSTDHNLPEGDKTLDSYYYFTWATGTTNKGSGKAGKNGVGKVVYQLTSNINSCLIFSSRDDSRVSGEPKNLLFGKCVLDPHELNGIKWLPESQWMIKFTKGTSETYIPSSDEAEIKAFLEDFTVTRKLNETGTSIVIPYVDEEFSARRIAQCVAQDYFIAILDGRLEVQVEDNQGFVVNLNASSIMQIIEDFDTSMETKTSKSKVELLKLCSMHIARTTKTSQAFEIAMSTSGKNMWNDDTEKLSVEQLRLAREALHEGLVLEFKIPVYVPKLGSSGQVKQDKFHVLIQKDDKSNLAATFSREGILIPKAAPKQISGYLAIALIDPGPLADLLGLAEGPAHQYWSWDEEKFKGVYQPQRAAEETIKFVKDSVKYLLQLVQFQKNEFDDMKYTNLFSLESDEGVKVDSPPVDTVSNQVQSKPKVNKVPKKRRKKRIPKLISDDFAVKSTATGFQVTASPESTLKEGDIVYIKVGYDLSSGDPLTFSNVDFNLTSMITKESTKTVKTLTKDGNFCKLRIENIDFKVEFSGFDLYRDLVVSVKNGD
jgi:hypothetical protein